MSDVSFDPQGFRQRGSDFASRLYSSYGNYRAGNQLAQGNVQGAANTLYRTGNIEGGRGIVNQAAAEATAQRTAQTAANTRRLEATLSAARALKGVRDGRGDVGAAFDQMAPALALATGSSPQELAAIRQQIASNPAFLDQIEAATAQQMEYELRAGANGDTVAVGLNPQTGETRSRLAYAAPQAPQVTPLGIINPPARALPVGQDTAYQPGTSTGAANIPQGVPAPQAPLTGPSISSSPLWDRQIQQESGGRQFASNGQVLTSPKGAFGVAQLMPGTAADLARQMGVTVEQLRADPALNEAAGLRYQQQQLEKYGGNEALALAAYNAGPGRVDEWIARFGDPRTGEITTEEFVSRIPFAETRNYVQNITQGEYSSGGGSGGGQSGVEDLGGGYTLQRMQTPADARAERAETRAEAAERRAQETALRQARTEERTERRLDSAEQTGARTAQATLRREFNARPEVKEFREVDNSYRTIENFVRQPSAAGDISLIFAFMKVLDPTSTVREGEFATASNAGGIPESVRNMANRAINGQRLQPRQRTDFLNQARAIRQSRESRYNEIVGEYRYEAEQQGFDPNRIVGGYGATGGNTRTRQTNAPGIPFNLAGPQLQARQRLTSSGASPTAPVGSPLNPRYVNPADERGSYANIRPGQWFVAPNGEVLQKPTERRR